MKKADRKCYKNRYTDVTKAPRRHFSEIGFDEGRLNTCGKNLTDVEAQIYIDRFPKLQRKFGRSGQAALESAKDYYRRKGYKKHEKLTVPEDWEAPWLCGDSELSTCQCNGTLYMGLLNSNDTGAKITNFYDLRFWKTVTKKSAGEWSTCNAAEFGSDPWPGQQKQCWCEPTPEYQPNFCSNEGGKCMCNGNVFFGPKYGENRDHAQNFWDFSNGYFTVNGANNTGSIQCKKKNFEGVDPAPGEDLGCYCDEEMRIYGEDEVQEIKEYWRGLALEKEARETQARAEAEASAASTQAAQAEVEAAAQ